MACKGRFPKGALSAFFRLKRIGLVLLLCVHVNPGVLAMDVHDAGGTRLVLLGTGTPNPSPDASGPAALLWTGGRSYLIDFGPGTVRRMAALSSVWGGPLEGFRVETVQHVFLTHLHSDHTAGLPDLILTPWVMGRRDPLQIWGPEGLETLCQNVLRAYGDDIHYRLYGEEPATAEGWKVLAHECRPGVVYEDEQVSVRAFSVEHGTWPMAFGFVLQTRDRKIVYSGDTRPCEPLVEAASKADLLVHEVYSEARFAFKTPEWKRYHRHHHTSTRELARLARRVQPRLLLLTHILYWGQTDEGLIREIREAGYEGPVVVGRDLGIY